MRKLLGLAGLFLALVAVAAHPSTVARGALTVAGQEPSGASKDTLPAGIDYSVKARWSGYGSKRKLKIELAVVNDGSAPVTVAFRSSARVCGALHDSKDKAYYRFPQASAQVMGTETFLPGKKLVFLHEIPATELRTAPPGTNAVAAWLCGYETVRAWAEFKMPDWSEE